MHTIYLATMHLEVELETRTFFSVLQLSDKLRLIHDIWSAGLGVVSLQLFHNTTASEAFTREACLIDAIGKGSSKVQIYSLVIVSESLLVVLC